MAGTDSPLVGVIMGSDSDLPTMQGALDVLDEFGIAREVRVVSAHRTPDVMYEYAGQRYSTRMARDPGTQLAVNVQPADSGALPTPADAARDSTPVPAYTTSQPVYYYTPAPQPVYYVPAPVYVAPAISFSRVPRSMRCRSRSCC